MGTKYNEGEAAAGGDATSANQNTIIADTTKIKNATYAIDGVVVTDGANTTSTFKTNLTNATNDFYKGMEGVFTSGNNDGQPRRISAYDGTTKFITVATAFSNIPSGDDAVQIVSRVAEAAAGGGDATSANQNTILTDVGRQVSMMEFWSEIDDIITFSTTTTNVAFPSIVVSDIPTGATVIHANCMIKPRAINNTFASVNAINGDIALQVKENIAGVFTDAIKLNDNSLSTAGSTKEGGLLIIGKYDCSGEVDGNDTYTMRSVGNSFVDGDSLEMIDVVAGIRVYFTA